MRISIMYSVAQPTLLTDLDIYLFKEGKHYRLYDKLGAHLMEVDGVRGTYFALWAPNAKYVSVIGDFNGWNVDATPMQVRWDSSGIWEGFVPNIGAGALYKYHISSNFNNYTINKADPFAFACEESPRTASIVCDLNHTWEDSKWMQEAKKHNALTSPISVYEVHLGSWKKDPQNPHRFLSYKEVAQDLIHYVKEMGFTHIEFLPLLEHPFYGSWGYQPLSFFASTSRFGTPQDFISLVDQCHQNNIGIILDWVSCHFPNDQHGLAFFDGTHLYEHADPRKAIHPEWKSLMFNYGRHEIQSFLISSAFFCVERYHADAIRVDAVASMLYLDYGKKEGEWFPNHYGGRENLESVEFIKNLNAALYANFPHIQTIAEESSSWPQVSHPISSGGLGFGMKWNMGWMHDTLNYMKQDPIYRKYHHNELTFSQVYFHNENFQLCLSHDEVVHEKRSLLQKMPGDRWQKFANLRLLYAYMYTHCGKKLLFMGQEFAQSNEWNHDLSLDWHLLQDPFHSGIQRWVKDLNHLYLKEPTLYEWDYVSGGFEWADCSDADNSVLAFFRRCGSTPTLLLTLCNFTPVPRFNYLVGVPLAGAWEEVLNSDAEIYGGSGIGNLGELKTKATPHHGRPYSLNTTLPPLSAIILRITP